MIGKQAASMQLISLILLMNFFVQYFVNCFSLQTPNFTPLTKAKTLFSYANHHYRQISSSPLKQQLNFEELNVLNVQRLGYSFSPGGLLFPYQLGVAKTLVENGFLTEESPVAGSSAGALVAACVGAGISFDRAMEACAAIIEECSEKGGAQYNIRGALDKQLMELLPVDVHEQLNSRQGAVGFAITQFDPLPRGKVITEFKSRLDVVEVLLASCCVPFWFTRGPAVMCRGWPAVDGFFAFEKEQFGCPRFEPSEATTTVRISPFPSSVVGLKVEQPGDIIAPDIDEEYSLSFQELLNYALNPYDSDFLKQLFNTGSDHAGMWISKYESTLQPQPTAVEQDAGIIQQYNTKEK